MLEAYSSCNNQIVYLPYDVMTLVLAASAVTSMDDCTDYLSTFSKTQKLKKVTW